MARHELGHRLAPLEEVRETILSHVQPLAAERVPLTEAHGRVLREDLVAREEMPSFDNSAMDGYAVRVSDLTGATEASPVTLAVQGGLPAGVPGGPPLEPGKAVRVMTGAPLPRGAEAVVPHELTRFTSTDVTFFKEARAGENVRCAGGDLRPGDAPLRRGEVLRPPRLAVAAALGYADLLVTRVPRVAVLSQGDELVGVGERVGPGQIRNSNAYFLAGALCESGVEPLPLGIVPDDKARILEAIRGAVANGADAIVSTGGVSAGDYDFVETLAREVAQPGYVFKVDMRPGKPQVFGLFGDCPLFGLPGNPASAVTSFEVFVRPALRKLCGQARILPETFGVRFPFEYRYKPGRLFLLRAWIEPDLPATSDSRRVRSGFRVAVPGPQGSSHLGSLANVNAIVFLPADRDRVAPDEVRPALWLGG